MDIESPEIAVQQMEQQLQEQGVFSPLTWLMDQGWLAYVDYEAWRQGDYKNLDERIPFTDDALRQWLERVERLATGLKLSAESQSFFSWRAGQGEQLLKLAEEAWVADRLALRWSRASDELQLDLFMDNGTALAEQAVVDALANRDLARAEAAYQRMLGLSPSHEALAGLEALLAYAGYLAEQPVIEADALADEFIALTQDIAPLAQRTLRDQARDFLAPAWRRLAEALAERPYDPDRPDQHASFAWAQVPDWPQVMTSVRNDPAHRDNPELLARWAWALQQVRQPERALWVWASLFEQAPQAAQELIARYPFPRIQQLWQRYGDLDQEWPDAWFVPWLLLVEPGLIHCRADAYGLPTPSGPLWQAAYVLVDARCQGRDEVPGRKQLQALAADLLNWYLAA